MVSEALTGFVISKIGIFKYLRKVVRGFLNSLFFILFIRMTEARTNYFLYFYLKKIKQKIKKNGTEIKKFLS